VPHKRPHSPSQNLAKTLTHYNTISLSNSCTYSNRSATNTSVPSYSEMYYANIINITLFASFTAAYLPSIKSTCLLASSHRPITLIDLTSITLPLFRRYNHNRKHFIGLKRYHFLRPSLFFTALLWCDST
jgi:hypothetical protein